MADKLKVFLSYSRLDSAFADEIAAGLDFDGGFDVFLDRQDIHEGEAWKTRLGALIAQADTVVFILSRKSAASAICRWEVDHAAALSKRIIPVQAEALGESEVPATLAALNYVRFDDGRSFMAGLTGLRRALNTDIDWLREQTRLLMRAQEWEAAGKPENRLLFGSDIASAKAWLGRTPAEGQQPTGLHRDFIQASDQAESLRLSAERQRAEHLERVVLRTRVALAIAVTLALVTGGLGFYANGKKREAEAAKNEAIQAADRAEKSAELATRESIRADRFVNLVGRHPAGQKAMEKICLEAIAVTSTLATTRDQVRFGEIRDRFWELYYASMYIVELHERKTSPQDVSSIEGAMVRFGSNLSALSSSQASLPYAPLCADAKAVRDGCADHLNIAAPQPCR